MNVSLKLPHLYEISIEKYWPDETAQVKRQWFASADYKFQFDRSITIRVTPNGCEPWVGTFATEHSGPYAMSAVLSTPFASCICVIAGGQGYIVQADDPTRRVRLNMFPILGAIEVESYLLLALNDFTTALAIGRTGEAWRTALGSDNVNISGMHNGKIIGTSFYAPKNRLVSFAIEPNDGSVVFDQPNIQPKLRPLRGLTRLL